MDFSNDAVYLHAVFTSWYILIIVKINKVKTIIAGSRSIKSLSTVINAFNGCQFKDKITEIVSGGATGVDQLGEQLAKKIGVSTKIFLANWQKYGKMAGMIRNREMAQYADALIAVYDGVSRGTKNMIEEATKRGLKIYVFNAKI
jgi:hypothetical protein